MFDKIAKSIVNYFLHLCIKNFDIKNFTLDVKESDGKYVLGINSTVVVGKTGESVRKETEGRNLMIVFFVTLSLVAVFAIVGILIPNASLGRSFILISVFPAFLANVIGARYIIKSIS